ncbi:hypothetical protein OG735_40965 [Streptomyces sp. NBC_01210]|uniref:hypothetical protein n=1 Tax=Streptomyces sp. NBC_01210 TaxID=2903774 RepID=UPI002E14AC22|nr:hypothetical protein OG735_00070 [Streptomyces sp. NBC_01210]WSR03806.1 hypothetical protein OG735_40965 [Streptomyces sp. NBC_01210]
MTENDGRAHNWQSIREWDGSQHRAFEELCFQLRTPAPPGWETIKTAAPDGGVEWYDQAPDGSAAHGYQVKFVQRIEDLLPQARKSARTVGENIAHRKIVRLEFLTPFDLSDPTPFTPSGKPRTGARERWNIHIAKWKELPGLAGVDIRYVGGGELLERLTRPGNEGRQWFFFEKRVLGTEWFREQVTLAERLAESRYTPEHHVALPLAQVADACALPQEFLRQFVQRARDLRAVVETLLAEMTWWLDRYPAPDSSPAHEALSQWVRLWTPPLREGADALVQDLSAASAGSGFPAEQAAAVAEDMLDRLGEFSSLADRFAGEPAGSGDVPAPPRSQPRTSRVRTASESVESMCEGPLARASNACEQVLALLRGSAAQAAEKGAWLLLGEAGQGKTHLLVDAARRAVDEGRPALVVFGQELSGHRTLSEIAQRCGLGQLPERDFLQAMDAAGAASGCRFLLIIDALNDSADAGHWKSELLALQGHLAGYRHIALAVSCRSTFSSLVVPDRFNGPASVHSGFAGREMEGLESYLRGNPAALPNTPLLASVFTNPLFVKLYADSLSRSQNQSTAGSGGRPRDRSAVFDAYVDHRAEAICTRLGLDPLERPVHRAVDALASHMAAEHLSVLPRGEARDLADACAPAATAWPDTMLGQLLAQGIVSNERTYGAEAGIGIGFPYQAFSDDRVVRSVFAAHQDEIESLRQGRQLAADSPLRNWLREAAPNYQEAASILLPEQAGTELIDLLASPPGPTTDTSGPDGRADMQHYLLARSFLETLPLRSTRSVNERTIALLNETAARHGRNSDVLEAVLAVTAEPGHLLNADRLHQVLARRPRPERDAWWGVETYPMVWDVTALHRLLRWAEQYPTPQDLHPASRPARPRLGARTGRPVTAPGGTEEVARLAATTLIWALTSSNRFLRDRATKALVQLLLSHGDVLVSLLDRFLHEDAEKVDDPYLFERLVWVAYGVVARRGGSEWQRGLLGQVARRITEYVYGDTGSPAHASRNALLCDAATRIVTMAHGAGVITDEEAGVVRHPHACPDIGQPPAEEDLDDLFPRREEDRPLWGSIRSSLSSLGDFADYEVRPAVRHFSMLPLASGYPRRPSWQRRDDPVAVDTDRIPAFAESLPESVRPALSTSAAVAQLLTGWKAQQVLDQDQYALLRDCRVPPADDERLAETEVDAAWAARWVLARVADLGWSPELFAEFDTTRGRMSGGRQSHKGERIGKKYQWMALHELVERLANHRHPHRTSEHDAAQYEGAARLYLLDIDPSLPPARHPFDAADDASGHSEADNATFPPADPAHPLAPPAPALPDDDGIDEWISHPNNLPGLEELGVRTDGQGREWVVLDEQAMDDHDGRGWSITHGQAEQWHRITSWTVSDDQFTSLLTWLKGRSLTNRLMPEGPDRHSLLFADFPTVPGPWTDPEPDTWHVSTFQYPDQEPGPDRPDGLDGPDDDDDLATPETTPAPAAAAEPVDALAIWREKRETKRTESLADLAEQWADGPVDDEDNWLERTLAAQPQAQIDRAADPAGQPVTAVPTTQTYSWGAQSSDCSLDASVSVTLLNDPLLRDSGLQRDPDRPLWYDTDGRLQVRYLSWDRPTGTAHSLLVSREWLEQRLQRSGHCLVQGMRGERQTVTPEHPRIWREFSQTAGHAADGQRTPGTSVTTLRRSLR